MHTRAAQPFAIKLLMALALAWFALLQSYGVIHNAKHGFVEHTHHGHLCPVYSFCEHQSLSNDTPTVLLPLLPSPPALTPQAANLTSPLTFTPHTLTARGPPTLS